MLGRSVSRRQIAATHVAPSVAAKPTTRASGRPVRTRRPATKPAVQVARNTKPATAESPVATATQPTTGESVARQTTHPATAAAESELALAEDRSALLAPPIFGYRPPTTTQPAPTPAPAAGSESERLSLPPQSPLVPAHIPARRRHRTCSRDAACDRPRVRAQRRTRAPRCRPPAAAAGDADPRARERHGRAHCRGDPEEHRVHEQPLRPQDEDRRP